MKNVFQDMLEFNILVREEEFNLKMRNQIKNNHEYSESSLIEIMTKLQNFNHDKDKLRMIM